MQVSSIVAALSLAAALVGQEPTATGPVSYQFQEAPLNARGVTSLQDLRGTPTIIEFWGVR